MSPRSVTFPLSDEAVAAFDDLAVERRSAKRTLRYGVTNAVSEFLDFIVKEHPEMLEEWLKHTQGGQIQGAIEYVDAGLPAMTRAERIAARERKVAHG